MNMIINKLSHSNDKECVSFRRLCLELVMMQKCADRKHILSQKDTDVKRCKLLNKTCSQSNVVVSELNNIYIHCTSVCVIIMIGLIIDVSQRILIVEYVMLFKQKIKRAFPHWLIKRTFDNYFYIKFLLNLYSRFMGKFRTQLCKCTMHV